MHADDLLLHDRDEGQAVEAVVEELPQLDVVAPLALVVKAVDPVDLARLVVAAQQEEVLRELDLEAQQQQHALHRLLPAVDVVAQEEVVGLRREAAKLEHAQQVGVLAVDVAADVDRRVELQQRRLLHEHLPALGQYPLDLILFDCHRRAAGPLRLETLDHPVIERLIFGVHFWVFFGWLFWVFLELISGGSFWALFRGLF